jgi:CubicO group peptidase (beta-lactamase class C family)
MMRRMSSKHQVPWRPIALTVFAAGTLAAVFTACQTSGPTDRPLPGSVTAVAPSTPTVPPPRVVKAAFDQGVLNQMEQAIEQTVQEQSIPGGVLWLERQGQTFRKAYGQRAILPAPEAMTEDTIFDIASLTKAIATAPAVMKLVEQARLQLDDRVQQHIPEFTGNGKAQVTLRPVS